MYLSDRAARSLIDQAPALAIAGGAIYDALVAAAALESGLPLATRDRRAVRTYRALQVDIEWLD